MIRRQPAKHRPLLSTAVRGVEGKCDQPAEQCHEQRQPRDQQPIASYEKKTTEQQQGSTGSQLMYHQTTRKALFTFT